MRAWSTVAMTAVLAVLVSACASQDDDESDRTETAGSTVEDIVEAAKSEAQEGEPLIVWISTPKLDDTHEALFTAFEQRFELPEVDYTWVNTSSPQMNRRLLTEASAGRVEPDIVNASQSTDSLQITEEGLVAEVDWAGIFGDELPEVSAAADGVGMPEYQDAWISLWDAAKVMMWNTEQTTADEVPDTLDGLTDPQWQGKVVLPSEGFVLDQLAAEIGEQELMDVAERLKANDPVFSKGSPAAMTAIASGQGAVSPVGTIGTIERLKEEGQPVDWKPLSYGIPVQQQWIAVTDEAKNPNLARLFVAWMVSEGQEVLVEHEFVSRLSYSDAPGATRLQQEYPDAEPLRVDSIEDMESLSNAREQLTQLFTGSG